MKAPNVIITPLRSTDHRQKYYAHIFQFANKEYVCVWHGKIIQMQFIVFISDACFVFLCRMMAIKHKTTIKHSNELFDLKRIWSNE